MIVASVVLLVAVAAANGGNDVAKGVATLGGAGIARYRTAIAWGTVTTLAGAVLSLAVSDKLTKLFSSGIVTAPPSKAFAVAVLSGVMAWVALATVARLPVSTTHAIVGALIGAGVLLGHEAVDWSAVRTKVALPLLLSIVVSFAISVALNRLPGRVPECICIDVDHGALAFTGTVPVRLRTGPAAECRAHGRTRITVRGLHWFSSGAASFARGLNDTPKIVAIGAFALVPAGYTTTQLVLLVAGAMAVGAVVAGTRVASRLGDDVVQMNDIEALKANSTIAVLVSLGARQGWPMSTTHVATGAIAGVSGGHLSRLRGRTLRDFALAWLITPLVAGTVAALVYTLVR